MASSISAAQLKDIGETIEKERRARLTSLGVSKEAQDESSLPVASAQRDDQIIRLMQFNALADGLANDGFLVRPVLKEWAAGPGRVPKLGGASVEFGTLLQEMLASRGNEAALRTLKANYDVPASRANFAAVADWQARRLQIQRMILSMGCPDILVIQELDNYAEMAEDLSKFGYTSKVAQCNTPYTPAHMQGYTDKDKESAEMFRKAWEAKGHAFLPHLHSNAMHISISERGLAPKILAAADALGLKNKVTDPKTGKLSRNWSQGLQGGSAALLKAAGISDPSCLDDMGVAVFWLSHKFTAETFKLRTYPGGGGGLVQVRLRETVGDHRELLVIGTHLSSGDSIKDEQKRLDNEVEPTNDGCLRICAEECCAQGDAVILMLDANSSPQSVGLDGSSSCCRSLRGALGASVWDKDVDSVVASKTSEGLNAPVTTNKVRGPLSGQAKKIGAHAYSLIDHIFFTPSVLEMQGHVAPPIRFTSSTAALEAVLPSLTNPSDHYPVVVDLAWRPAGESNAKKRKIGGA